MTTTLLLDRTAWDLVVDASGNIAVAADPYAVAQDVASAIKLFKGELWYGKTKGIPYWASVLGFRPPLSFVKSQIVRAALTVPRVVQARCIIASFVGRSLTGQVQIKVAPASGSDGSTGGLGNQMVAFDGSPLNTFDGSMIVSF